MTTYETNPPLKRSGRHPVNIGHFVMGVAFVGIVVVWILIQSDAVTGDDIRWLLPVPWVLAGVAGLLASTRRHREGDEWRDAAYVAHERGWVGGNRAAEATDPPHHAPAPDALDDLDEKLARAERETSVRQSSGAPAEPADPADPHDPEEPEDPRDPADPVDPADPTDPKDDHR